MNYLEIFKQICQISRPSHDEGAIADFLCNFAKERNLEHERDERNCVVIRKPATPGYESHEPVVILNHMDMVCVADAGYNTPGQVSTTEYEEGGERWMKANHTSLGADNGIGLSMALAVIDDDTLPHPALEILCTTCEEDDMSGAAGLAPDFVKGRRVLNLDSEAYNEITTGSAGAYIQLASLPYTKVAMPPKYQACQLTVSGGKGGHSGVDIGKGRANAIKILANLLLVAIRQADIKLYLVSFNGGQAYSAIPDEAEAKVVIPQEDREHFMTLVAQCNYALAQQFGETDPGITVECEESVWHSTVISEEGTHVLLACINGIPVGPVESDDKRVVTSNNIGIVKQAKTHFSISSHTRSFYNDKMQRLATDISHIFTLVGAEVKTLLNTKPWNEDTNHPFVKQTMETFDKVLGFKPEPVSMHFVLEASLLTDRFPGMHIASIGPRIINPHSTDEHISLTTADNIWKVVTELLKNS